MKRDKLINNVLTITQEVCEVANLKTGDLFVLGLSTSEVAGGVIGQKTTAEVGEWIVQAIKDFLDDRGIGLAVQGCEHINRALVIERKVQITKGWEEVMVVPVLKAGGAGAVAAYGYFDDPVIVEHVVAQAGIDIGDTSIGMHVKHVQIPVRPSIQELGGAHVTALRSRPKYIGGPRAQY